MNRKLREIIANLPMKTFRILVGKEFAIGFIEGVLKKADADQVLYMIDNDLYNLFMVDGKAHALSGKARKILKAHEDIVKTVVTIENVLEVIRESRPDIYSLIINHPKGINWVRNTIKETLEYALS